jgi:hypothetical protein
VVQGHDLLRDVRLEGIVRVRKRGEGVRHCAVMVVVMDKGSRSREAE